ncbi:MAG: M55 family metallopeptidase, partial [Kiritimatiellaeota bacterium]|nr:M55 family metallopeptidase [Kiritimatiellota bacterium]
MKVLIVTDLEGVSGITEWDAHEPRTPQDRWQRTLMTGEVNAAVAGAFDAGATRVKIAEGHNAIDILQLDERATLVPAHYPAMPPYQGWDEGFDAMLQIGKHAMSGTPDGVLAHTGNRNVDFVEVNGIRVGECGNEAMMAGDYGFPCIMISGDAAVCREMLELLGDIETAPVKTGYTTHHADCLHPNVARRLIREKVCAALERLSDFKPFVVPGPVRLVQRLKKPYGGEALQALAAKPFVEVVDEHTVAFLGRNMVEAFA